MEISGLVKSSLIDYPGKVAAVIFTQGCNFRCGFCHNPSLIPIQKGLNSQNEIIDFLKTRVNKLDGVVITGGEPTVYPDLISLIKQIKSFGFLIKLDTNGSNPGIVKDLIDKKLIDYVAMDIKGTLEEYPNISHFMNTKVIQESIDFLKISKINYEFRTTVIPYYHRLEDFHIIGTMLEGAELFTIQGFRPQVTFDSKLQGEASFTMEELEKISKIMKKYVKKVNIHANL